MPRKIVIGQSVQIRAYQELKNSINRDFVTAINDIRQNLLFNNLPDLVSRQDMDAILTPVRRTLNQFVNKLNTDRVNVASRLVRSIGRKTRQAVEFNPVDEAVVTRLTDNLTRMRRMLVEGQVAAITNAVQSGVSINLSPKRISRDVITSLGLSETQLQAVNNYRVLLETRSRRALDRALRDRRSDRLIASALRDERPFTKTQINSMVRRYRDNVIRSRAGVIARTEAHRAVNEMEYEAFKQFADQQGSNLLELRRVWKTSRDERVRSSHRELHNTSAGFDEPFTSENRVELLYPGDSNAPADETVNCRCFTVTEITLESG